MEHPVKRCPGGPKMCVEGFGFGSGQECPGTETEFPADSVCVPGRPAAKTQTEFGGRCAIPR